MPHCYVCTYIVYLVLCVGNKGDYKHLKEAVMEFNCLIKDGAITEDVDAC